MSQTLPADPLTSLRAALTQLRHWDSVVHRATRDYAAAKVAVNADRDDARAAAVFTAKADAMMHAMEQRHHCETEVAALRKVLRRFH